MVVLEGAAVSYERGTHALKRLCSPRLANLPGQWLQCQANGSNVCRECHFSTVEVGAVLQPLVDGPAEGVLQGYFSDKKTPPHQTLQ